MELLVDVRLLKEALARLQSLVAPLTEGRCSLLDAAPRLRQLCADIAALQAAINGAGSSRTALISSKVGRALLCCEAEEAARERHLLVCRYAAEAVKSGDAAELAACLEEEARTEQWMKEVGIE